MVQLKSMHRISKSAKTADLSLWNRDNDSIFCQGSQDKPILARHNKLITVQRNKLTDLSQLGTSESVKCCGIS
jgi:hypothetical protein